MRSVQEAEIAKLDLFEAIAGQSSDAVIFADRDGAIRIWTRGAETIFGRSVSLRRCRVKQPQGGKGILRLHTKAREGQGASGGYGGQGRKARTRSGQTRRAGQAGQTGQAVGLV